MLNLTDADSRFIQKTLNKRGYGLAEDGKVGPKTMEAGFTEYAKSLGVQNTATPVIEIVKPAVPSTPLRVPDTAPPFLPMSSAERVEIFGNYTYSVNNDSTVNILGSWERDNIISVMIPQLQGVPLYSLGGKTFSGMVRLHRLAAGQFKAFFAEVERQGLKDRILTYDGGFYARMIRGSKTSLSNHAFGSAIDINAEWNGLGREPAKLGQLGSLVELVPIAHRFGLYWGGNFSRKDGMHFEVSKVLDL